MDVRPGHKPDDLLRQRRLVGAHVRPDLREPRREPLSERLRGLAGAPLDTIDQPAERYETPIEIGSQVASLVRAHAIQLVQRRADRIRHHRLDVRVGLQLRRPGRNRDHLRKSQQLADRPAAAGRTLDIRPGRDLHEGGDQLLVDFHLHRRTATATRRDSHLHPAAGQTPLHLLANPRLQSQQARRQMDLQVEVTVIHAARGDAHGQRLVFPRQGRETGHRLDHGLQTPLSAAECYGSPAAAAVACTGTGPTAGAPAIPAGLPDGTAAGVLSKNCMA